MQTTPPHPTWKHDLITSGEGPPKEFCRCKLTKHHQRQGKAGLPWEGVPQLGGNCWKGQPDLYS